MLDFPPLWSDFHLFEQNTALVEAATGNAVTYGELLRLIAAVKEHLPKSPKLLLALRITPTIESIAIYIGALYAGHAVLLGSALTAATVHAYKPDLIVLDQKDMSLADLPDFASHGAILGRSTLVPQKRNEDAIHPSIALVIPTSGSTGAKRFMKLSYRNIHSSALQVASGLNITSTDCAITNLPLDYVYGLSILHSHLKVGGRMVLEPTSYLAPKFWDSFRKFEVTGLGGVPFTYQALKDKNFERYELPSLATLTQAGGALNMELRSWLVRTFGPRGVRVCFMYGLSEATGRVTILPQASLGIHLGSVGVAVPYGAVTLGENNEVVYKGPNVMLGYAMSREDLRTGDTIGGILRTGDQGLLTADGHLYIKGRLSRFGKVFGKRIALDELEEEFAGGSILCMDASDDRLNVYHNGSDLVGLRSRIMRLCLSLQVPPQAVRPCEIADVPRTANGKIDYPRLREMKSGTPGVQAETKTDSQ